MSDMGDLILEMMSIHSSLREPDNDMARLLDYTVGEWLQREDDEPFFEQFFLQDATGPYLDLHGRDFGVLRKCGESDDVYRERIVMESMSHLTSDYLRKVYGVELYYYLPDFDVDDNVLTSDNPYLVSSDGFMGVAPSAEVEEILDKKFILDGGVTWL